MRLVPPFFLNTMRLVLTSLIVAGCSRPEPSDVEAAGPMSLLGSVASAEEGVMEGVIVSAKKGIVTVSVVSDENGRFAFPVDRLGAGDYALSIKAPGFDLQGPAAATVPGDTSANVELTLVKTTNLAAQLSNREWIASVPGTPQQKRLISGCTNCHSVERIMTSTYDKEGFMQTIARMATYSNNSFHLKPQLRAVARDVVRFTPNGEADAAYLASINRSQGEWTYPLKALPRVQGAGTKVLITEFDLPRPDTQPHDVLVDGDGIVWYSDFGDQFLGRFDPKTLAITEYPVPLHRENYPKGALDLEEDAEGNLWLGLMFQAGVARFDKKSESMKTFPLPADIITETSQQAMVAPHGAHVDGKVWMTETGSRGLRRLDLATGAFEYFDPYKDMEGPHSIYSIMADDKNNLWFLDYAGEAIGMIDAKTAQTTLHQTPTPRSRPRRGRLDSEGRVWFAEFAAEHVGVLDTKTGEIKEWEVPGGYFAPYDAMPDKEGKVWTAGMNADRVLRLDPATGIFEEFPLPRYTNVRRLFVDNSTPRPTVWIGNNHGAAIIRMELTD